MCLESVQLNTCFLLLGFGFPQGLTISLKLKRPHPDQLGECTGLTWPPKGWSLHPSYWQLYAYRGAKHQTYSECPINNCIKKKKGASSLTKPTGQAGFSKARWLEMSSMGHKEKKCCKDFIFMEVNLWREGQGAWENGNGMADRVLGTWRRDQDYEVFWKLPLS